MSKGEYPPDILLVGGTHDGEYWHGAPRDTLQLAKPGAKLRAAIRVDDPQAGTLETETYRLRQFGANNQVLVLYGLDSLDDFQIQLALIRGYRRKKGD